MAERHPAGAVVLIVRLGENLHGVPIEWVEEVLPALPLETVPQCPEFVRGVVFVRGHLIPVLDAAERLGIEGHRRAMEPHIVCLRIRDRLIGVEFDEALDLMDLGPGEWLAADRIGARQGFFAGLIERDGQIVRLLDPEKLMAEEEADGIADLRLPISD
jgi:purine-binding chemotaxis protein CheW